MPLTLSARQTVLLIGGVGAVAGGIGAAQSDFPNLLNAWNDIGLVVTGLSTGIGAALGSIVGAWNGIGAAFALHIPKVKLQQKPGNISYTDINMEGLAGKIIAISTYAGAILLGGMTYNLAVRELKASNPPSGYSSIHNEHTPSRRDIAIAGQTSRHLKAAL